jgi:acyl-CoA synthetase (AMP-forming)/AMP-acid ligase II
MTDQMSDYVQRSFGTLSDMVQIQAQTRPDRLAIVHRSREVSYSAFDAEIDRFAAALQAERLGSGDAVAICSLSCIEYAVGFLGTLRAGAAAAPLAPSSSPDALIRMIDDCGARVLLVDAASFSALAPFISRLPVRVVRIGQEGPGGYEEFLAPKGARPTPVEIDPDSAFNIIYSSGTTGTPKGIVQSHRMRWPHTNPVDPPGYGPEAVSLLSTPLYSNTTLVSFVPTLSGGGTAVLLEKFEARTFLELAQKWRVTHAMLVPVQYRRLMDFPEFDAFDLSSFVMKYCTSAPFSADLKAEVLRRWPGGLIEYYGMTEGGGSCMLVAHEHTDKLHTVGQPMPGHEMRVIDEHGREAPSGTTGEIVGTSKAIMNGYHNQPDKTAEAEWYAPDGRRFIRTGDVGRFDAEGFLTLMDRKKDLIISGGFNIYPSDLEALLMTHPEVADAAVVGIESRDWGETPVAFVVLRQGRSIDSAVLRDWANARLGKTQRINDLRIVSDLPRSAIGKILKRELRSAYTAGKAAS